MKHERKFWLFLVGLIVATTAYAGIIVHGQLVDAQLENLSADPTSRTGRVYFNTTGNTAKFYNGSAWRTIVDTTTAFANPMTTQGDTIYEDVTPQPARLAKGTATQLLHSGNTPSWSAVSLTADVTGTLPTASGGTNAASWTTGSVPYLSGATTFAEDNANFFWDGTNHRLGLGTASPGTRLEIRNGHVRSTITTAPTATVNAGNTASGTCTLANATDMAGKITVVTGAGATSEGPVCVVNFNVAFSTAPVCVISPLNIASVTGTIRPNVSTSTSGLTLSVNAGSSATLIYYYLCMETQ